MWYLSHRADKRALPVADRHYNRRKIGSPQFVPPGRCLVLKTKDSGALWTTSWPFAEFTKHRWGGAWVNSMFRREHGPLASVLIQRAVAITRWYYPDTPALGMVTFIDPRHVKSEVMGACYRAAKFKRERCCCAPRKHPGTFSCNGISCEGLTQGGLMAFRLTPARMPDAVAPDDDQLTLL